jgi:integrase
MAGKRGHRGFGHVRKLPSKRWQASYLGPDLARHNALSTFDTREDAEGWLAAERALINADKWVAPERRAQAAKRGRLTLAEYANTWLEQRNLKPRTHGHYRVLLDKFVLPELGDMPLPLITPDVVRAWHARLITGPTYKAHAYSLLRTIMRTALDDGLIAQSPCVIRGAGRATRAKQIKPATLDELTTIVAAMPERLRLLVLLAAWCALRFGELAELRRKDVDVRSGVIHVRRGVTWADGVAVVGPPKSSAGVRNVNIPPHLLPAVKAHLKDHAGLELVFPSPRGPHLTSTMLYEHWWPAREAAGRPDLRFHDLRHTGAVLAARSGATIKELMPRLGHSTPSMAMAYQHAAAQRDREIAAKLSDLANGSEKLSN